MKLKISFKHLDHTPALDERIKEKSEKLTKYFQGNISVQWVCWVKDNQHWAEIQLHGPKFDFFAKACADNMYKSLDLVIDKMERQIEKQKDMKRNKLHAHPYGSPKYQEIQKQVQYEEEVYFQELEEKSAESKGPLTGPFFCVILGPHLIRKLVELQRCPATVTSAPRKPDTNQLSIFPRR
jgi:putative sigma-54 modulation protein